MPGNKAVSEADKPWVRACDKDMSGCDSVMTDGAGGVVTCTWMEMIQVVGMKSVSCDKLKTHGLEIMGALDKTPLGEVWKSVRSGLGENRIMRVQL